jgi:hypothetical protein
MKKIKVSESTGPVLDWLVAKCELGDTVHYVWEHARNKHRYSTNWAQGGPVIERERINTLDNGGDFSCYYSRGAAVGIRYTGPTPLIAAMRCCVISKLGEEVGVPEELT